jgi:hypothetical protein
MASSANMRLLFVQSPSIAAAKARFSRDGLTAKM